MKTKETTGNQITEGVIWKQLLFFFFPIMLGTLFQQLYNTADAVVVGRFVGTKALAAVGGSTGQMVNLIVGFFVGLSSGATVIIARYYGAKNKKDLNDTLHTAAALSVAGGILITIAGILLTPAMLQIMKTPADVMADSATYLRIYFGGIIFVFIYNVGSAILRAVGDSTRPLYFLIVCCFINIFLDIVLVVGFDMGVAGAAIATVASQAVSAVLVIHALMKSKDMYCLRPKAIRFHKFLLLSIITIGLPAGIQSVMYNLSNMIIQTSSKRSGNQHNGSIYCFRKNRCHLLDDFRCFQRGNYNLYRAELRCRKISPYEKECHHLPFYGFSCLCSGKRTAPVFRRISVAAFHRRPRGFKNRYENYSYHSALLCAVYFH